MDSDHSNLWLLKPEPREVRMVVGLLGKVVGMFRKVLKLVWWRLDKFWTMKSWLQVTSPKISFCPKTGSWVLWCNLKILGIWCLNLFKIWDLMGLEEGRWLVQGLGWRKWTFLLWKLRKWFGTKKMENVGCCSSFLKHDPCWFLLFRWLDVVDG